MEPEARKPAAEAFDATRRSGSLIGRLALLAPRCNSSGRKSLRHEDERLFRRWLTWKLEEQLADVRAHSRAITTRRERWLQVGSYSDLIPLGAEASERLLFFCHLEAILAVLSNEHAEARGIGDWRVHRALEWVAQERGRSSLRMKVVGEGLRISEARLGVIFKRYTGLSFRRYARALRIRRAVELMREPNRTTSEIAQELGYSDVSNFVRDFRSALERTPGAFRNMVSTRTELVLTAGSGSE